MIAPPPKKPDGRYDTLDHPQRVTGDVLMTRLQRVVELEGDDRHGSRAKRHQHMGPYPGVLAPHFSVEPEEQSEEHGAAQPQRDFARVDRHLKMHAFSLPTLRSSRSPAPERTPQSQRISRFGLLWGKKIAHGKPSAAALIPAKVGRERGAVQIRCSVRRRKSMKMAARSSSLAFHASSATSRSGQSSASTS